MSQTGKVDGSGFFLLVATDADHISGKMHPSLAVANERLRAGLWPLYRRTPNKDLIKSGDMAVIYTAGQKTGSGLIIAEVVIGTSTLWLPKEGEVDHEDILTAPAYKVLRFHSVRFLEPPVKFRSVLPILGCCPPNMSKWGSILRGGVKRLSYSDYATLLS